MTLDAPKIDAQTFERPTRNLQLQGRGLVTAEAPCLRGDGDKGHAERTRSAARLTLSYITHHVEEREGEIHLV